MNSCFGSSACKVCAPDMACMHAIHSKYTFVYVCICGTNECRCRCVAIAQMDWHACVCMTRNSRAVRLCGGTPPGGGTPPCGACPPGGGTPPGGASPLRGPSPSPSSIMCTNPLMFGRVTTWRNEIVLLQKKLHRFKKSLYHFFKGCVLVSAQILLIFFVPGENFRNPYPDKNFQLFPYRPILSLSLSLSLSNSLSLFLKKKKKGEGGRGNRPGT